MTGVHRVPSSSTGGAEKELGAPWAPYPAASYRSHAKARLDKEAENAQKKSLKKSNLHKAIEVVRPTSFNSSILHLQYQAEH